MTTTIIFDLDGLLINSEVISLAVYQQMVQEYGHELTTATYAQTYSGRSGITNTKELIANFDLPIDLDTGLQKSLALERELMKNGVALKPGARELLTFLRDHHYQVALASSSTPERAHNILKANGVDQFFDSFTFRDEVTVGKPGPDIFLKAYEKLGQRPEDCIVIEDSEAGIQAANAAKIPVICIPDMKTPTERFVAMTLAVYPSLSDVINHLQSA